MIKYPAFFSLFILCLISCKEVSRNHANASLSNPHKLSSKMEGKAPVPQLLDTAAINLPDTSFVDVTLFSKQIIPDIRYATKNNFTRTQLYPCAKCLLRYKILKALLHAESMFLKRGFRIKVFDCYRPLSVQKKLWEKVPVPGLVANPATGSRHNRGSAIDLTLTDMLGNELDMGTDFDDFSYKGKTFCKTLPDTVKKNRMLLRSVMQAAGFAGINSEWWHFLYVGKKRYKLSNHSLCD
ncbi:MAG: peptidase M15 [Bacteroidia bacterium]|nr:MAG: peptidase M15 [Bacteroidia bacterium]